MIACSETEIAFAPPLLHTGTPAALAACGAAIVGLDVLDLADLLDQDTSGITESAKAVLPSEQDTLLLVIDQFEQWLHAHRAEQETQLVQALRQINTPAAVVIGRVNRLEGRRHLVIE